MIFTLNFYEFLRTMYVYVLNSVVKISLMFAEYFEYHAIVLRGAVFLWTHYYIVCLFTSKASPLMVSFFLHIFMATICNRAGHYIFALWFLSSSFFFISSPNLSGQRLDVYHTSTQKCEFRMQVWNVLHAARWKYRMQKIAIWAPSHNFVGLYLRN